MVFIKKIPAFVLMLVLLTLPWLQSTASAERIDSVKDHFEEKNTAETDKAEPEQSEENTPAVTAPASIGITVWDIFKMLFATAFVVGLLYFLLKFVNKRSRIYKSNQLVENLGGAALGNNKSVQIIKVGDRLLIVGVGENIQLLKEIDHAEEYNDIIEAYNQNMEQLVQPSDFVTKVIGRWKNQQPEKREEKQFPSILKEQLDDIAKKRKKIFDEMEKKGPDGQ